ncbi:type II toxin-antitoxin system RelE/ParE family toxin [bacterium]|nr:type II toxin-antitoxin system RelE/ParE family toxin [bacterium]MBU1995123.1 type II toxin-antitoxin system RelE/ParE family toxin [bacterium]
MKIVYEEHFVKSLKDILNYIALDKKSAAKTFKSKLITYIEQILNNPNSTKKLHQKARLDTSPAAHAFVTLYTAG